MTQRLRARLRDGPDRPDEAARSDPGELDATSPAAGADEGGGRNLEFEKAATLRDRIKQLRSRELGWPGAGASGGRLEMVEGRASSRSRSTSACSARPAARVVTPPFYYRDIVEQFDAIGIGSLTVVLLTGTSPGWCWRCNRASRSISSAPRRWSAG
jgi:hypothetical protein